MQQRFRTRRRVAGVGDVSRVVTRVFASVLAVFAAVTAVAALAGAGPAYAQAPPSAVPSSPAPSNAAPSNPAASNPASSKPGPLTLDDWRADLAFVREELPRRHVDPWQSLTPAAFEASLDRLEADLDGLGEHEIVVRIAEIVAALGDGHSRLTLPMDPGSGFFTGHPPTTAPRVASFRHLPLRIAPSADGYVVVATDAAHAGLLGLRVLGIGERSMDEVEAALAPVVHRDNAHGLADWLPWFMVVPEILHARGVAPTAERIPWRFEDARGRPRVVTLEPVARGATVEWQPLPAPDWPAGRRDRGDDGLWFADATRPAAVYARIAEIADTPARSYAQFTLDLQAQLGRTTHRRLVLDLRGNPGGDNTLNPALLRALIRTDWVSEPGALLVLIDGGTFSAAMNLVEDLERWLPTVFVGAGTAGRPNHFGDARKYELPRSGLTLRLSSLYWQNHPRDARSAIEPLIPVPIEAAQLRDGIDPAAAVLGGLDDALGPLAGRWQGRVAVDFRQLPLTLELQGDDVRDGSLQIKDLGVEDAPVRLGAGGSNIRRGDVSLRQTTAPIAFRAGGGRLIGWIEYRGNRYPFVLERG
jgi:hypothetical protein